MAQVINTNVAALFAGAALNRSNTALQTAQARLSSGVRINTAKDDPTGLVNASGFEATMRGSAAAARGVADAVSAAQTNDGFASQIYEMTQKLREIAVIAGGTASGVEYTALIGEITRVRALIAATSAVVINTAGGTIAATGTAPAVTAGSTVANYDTDLTSITTARASYGADMSRFQSALNVLQTQSVNAAAQYSRVMDTDYAAETAAASKNQILQQAGMAALAQANQNPSSVLTLLR
jgi:flagellin